MTDVFTRRKRSEVMSQIRGRGNKQTEMALMALFGRHRVTGWRRHKSLFGNPDFVFPRFKTAIFVDGCFWHSCPKHATKPKNNASFWRKKLAGNKERDRLVTRTLRAKGWQVVRIWEHELKSGERVINRILQALKKASSGIRP